MLRGIFEAQSLAETRSFTWAGIWSSLMFGFRNPTPSVKAARRLLSPCPSQGWDPSQALVTYMSSYRGRHFDLAVLANLKATSNCFTNQDLQAIQHLSVKTTSQFDSWLLSQSGQASTSALLSNIKNIELTNLSAANFPSILGTGSSPASQLWSLLLQELERAGQPKRFGTRVTASKLLASKRPGLMPIPDTRIRGQLKLTWPNSWFRYWQIMQDPQVVSALINIRHVAAQNKIGCGPSALSSSQLSRISLTRILDIVAWMR
jgi:Family of unknown function (DUF6308)